MPAVKQDRPEDSAFEPQLKINWLILIKLIIRHRASYKLTDPFVAYPPPPQKTCQTRKSKRYNSN